MSSALNELAAGLRHEAVMTVDTRHLVPSVGFGWPGFADMPPVFATAMLVGFIEQTCIELLRPHYLPGQHSVGTEIAVSHDAPTGAGCQVKAKVELIAVEGRMLTFAVEASDDAGVIGGGLHRRALIDVARFMSRLETRYTA
jgi:fluoroacetyl-CoA thioesterase